MELKESRQTIRIPKIVCKESEERAVDMDIVLPDYCPDVTAILKCRMEPTVYSGHQSGDRYTVDGVVKIRILYLSDDRRDVHCFEASQPFSAVFRCDGAVHYRTEVKIDYLNCRAIGPKRVDIHGAFRVFLTAIGEGSMEVFKDPQMHGIYCRNKTISTTIPFCETEKTLVVDEAIHLGVTADKWLYADMTVASCEHKLLTNKAIVKGTLLMKGLYKYDGRLHRLIQEIPFSQIVDVDGLVEGMICDTEVHVCECDCHLQQNEAGASIVYVSCKLNSYLRCNQRETATVVLDAYSVNEPMMCRTVAFQTDDKSQISFVRHTLQEFVPVSDTCVSVEDQWGEIRSCEMCSDDDGQYLSCCVLVCMLVKDSDGMTSYVERMVDCRIPCDEGVQKANVKLIQLQCTMNGNKARLQMDVQLCREYADVTSCNVVTDAVLDENQPYVHTAGAIRIVYASEGESVWDIAKTNHSCVEDICAENDLSEEYIRSSTMLMIPMI